MSESYLNLIFALLTGKVGLISKWDKPTHNRQEHEINKIDLWDDPVAIILIEMVIKV